MNSRSKLKNSE